MHSILLLAFLAAVSAPVNGGTFSHGYHLKTSGGYTKAADVASNSVFKLLKREDYVKTATELVKSVTPNATFRLVDDHYTGTNGISHANFRQTTHSLDIDNADFSVHVSMQ